MAFTLSGIAEALALGIVGAIGGDIYHTIAGKEQQIVDLSENAYRRIRNIIKEEKVKDDLTLLKNHLNWLKQCEQDYYGREGETLNRFLESTGRRTNFINDHGGYKISESYQLAVALNLRARALRLRYLVVTKKDKKEELAEYESGKKDVTEREIGLLRREVQDLSNSIEGAQKNIGQAAFDAVNQLVKQEKDMRAKEKFTVFEYGDFKRFAALGGKCHPRIVERGKNPQVWFGDKYPSILKSLLQLTAKYNTGNRDFEGNTIPRATYMCKFIFGIDFDIMQHLWSAKWVNGDYNVDFYRCTPTKDGYFPLGDMARGPRDVHLPMFYLRHCTESMYRYDFGHLAWDSKGAGYVEDQYENKKLSLHSQKVSGNQGQGRDTIGYAAMARFDRADEYAFQYIARLPNSDLDKREKLELTGEYRDEQQSSESGKMNEPTFNYPIVRWNDDNSGADDSVVILSAFIESRGRIRTTTLFKAVKYSIWDRDTGKDKLGIYTKLNLKTLDGIWIDIAPPHPTPHNWTAPADALPKPEKGADQDEHDILTRMQE